MANPFDYKNPWCPFKGNGYTLNEYEFVEWYGMTIKEYFEECKRRGVLPDRSEPEEYDPPFKIISTNDAFELSEEDVVNNLQDIMAKFGITVSFSDGDVTVEGDIYSWREFMNSYL